MTSQLSRRDFLLAGAGAVTGGLALGSAALAAQPAAQRAASNGPLIWAYLAHLGYNMWHDREIPNPAYAYWAATDKLRCETPFWHELMEKSAKAGVTMMIIDLGEGVRYDSHPELGIEGSWSTAMLRDELKRIRDLGMEPIPKMNFSAVHDLWLGPYARQVSTPAYYKACDELIAEAIDLFDKPRYFHLGMDEETAQHSRHLKYVVLRQHDLWWEDFARLVAAVEKGGSRPWIWSDYVWENPEPFYARMPKSVLQSNWHYSEEFDPENVRIKAYLEMEAAGFDQVPTGSNWSNAVNFGKTVEFCRKHIAPERLKGFMQTPWKPTMEVLRKDHEEALAQVAAARKQWEST